ncbi:MAG: TAT-variant-translocated molybdopterin oxidoreductase, partial [Candidatus Acidiferrum sp.]
MRENDNLSGKLHGGEAELLRAHGHTHHHEHHDHEDDTHDSADVNDGAVTEQALDLAAVRAQLATKTGKQYWRTLEELSGDPRFEQLLHREFPRQASEWDDAVDRRDFLKLMAASLAFAGLSGCGKAPEEHIIPYVKQPDGLVLGKPQFYATAMPFGADAIGVLVESHEGRPTNIQGNPDHPSSMGAVDSFVQASVLNLYDPDRSQVPNYLGDISSIQAFREAAQNTAGAMKTMAGEGLRILTGTVASPLVSGQIQALLKLYPRAKWHQWEPAGNDGAREGSKMAFGRYMNTVYRPEKAEVILSLDADFMASGPGHIRYMKQFYRRRKLDNDTTEMNRLYVVEPTPSVTGATADHRLPLRSSDVGIFTRALAAKVGLGGVAELPAAAQHWMETVRA